MGNIKWRSLGWVMFLILILNMGCQDPILVGSELLEDEKLNLGYTDSLSMRSQTIAGERLVTHRPSVDYRTYLLGQLNDNIFGKVSAEIYLSHELQSTKPNYHLNTAPLKFDSLVLVLLYDTLATYANQNAAHKIELFQLTEMFAETDTFYSDINLGYNSVPLVETSLVTRPKDSVSILDHVTRKIIKLAPQMRLRLDDNFGTLLLNNSGAASNDTAFVDFIKGFYLKSTPLSNPSIVGFNFSNNALNTQNAVNKLIMYYTVGDTTRKEYQYLINPTTINRFVHDISGSIVEDVINNPSKGDSLTYLQAMGGVKTFVHFNDLSFLDDKLINKVELEVFVADLPGQNGTYTTPLQLIASRKKTEGGFELIPDVAQLISSGLYITDVFGGVSQGTGTLKSYRMNITNHIKRAVKDKTYNSDLYLGVLNESETSRRAVFYGAKHSSYPMKLKVSYTKI
ncbi:MAG: DUF4270 family protein [Saprospiraceae bacterium]|nr:DUF4270 family protein [Saprospiraceae bacterium]